MKPAYSVIVFTIVSGAGLGLIVLSGLLFASASGLLGRTEAFAAGGVGLALTALGLISSTFHLANPKNAWRAFSRFQTSWLSREAVFALLLYPSGLAYVLGLWLAPQPGLWVKFVALITALLALATLFATGMIYACLRTIPQWHTSLVPSNYILLGLASGALLLMAVVALSGGPVRAVLIVSVMLLLLAALGKALYYAWIGQPQGSTINTATGFTRAGVRLLDIGHSSGTFHTREFGYCVPPGRIASLRLGVFVLLFAVPLGFSVIVWDTGSKLAVALMLLSATIGLAVERWLFFAEARHSISLYHGRQTLN